MNPTRRNFLKVSTAATAGLLASRSLSASAAGGAKLPIAGVTTVYRRNSHADVILGKILEGYDQLGGPGPNLKLVSLYVDQQPRGDMSRALSEKHGFPIVPTIDEAIGLGGDEVAVAGVLSIGEHGNYPYDPVTRQHKYPRKRFFDEIVAAMQRRGKFVPVFNDKHLSYRTDESLQMYRTAKKLGFPFMAGSSLPVAWRVPALDLPMGCAIDTAVAIGYGGLEAYGFHTLETLQCMLERRRGGEVGVRAVRAVSGEAILETEKQGYWSEEVLLAALRAQIPRPPENWKELVVQKGTFFLIDYRDGLKATVAMMNGIARQFSFGCKLKDRPTATAALFALQNGVPYRHFEWLVKATEHMFHSGEPAYPVERTVLTSGILDAAMHSHAQGGKVIDTGDLAIRYTPRHWAHAPGRPPEPREPER